MGLHTVLKLEENKFLPWINGGPFLDKAISKQELIIFLKEEWNVDYEEKLERLEDSNSSHPLLTAEEIIKDNKLGPNGESLSFDEIKKKYI